MTTSSWELGLLDNVRVVDASVTPAVVSSNTNATVYAIAELITGQG